MSRIINISIHGGQSSIGSINQAESLFQNFDSSVERLVNDSLTQLTLLAAGNPKRVADLPALNDAAKRIAAHVKQSDSQSKVNSLLALIKDHHEWAFPVLSGLATALWSVIA